MNRRVLAVDDDPATTRVLRHLLETRGYEVREVNNPERALHAAREFQPHVVILDYLMPGLHGGDVAWQLVSDPLLQLIDIVVCSGLDPAELRSKLPPRAVILRKPVGAEALLDFLDRQDIVEPPRVRDTR